MTNGALLLGAMDARNPGSRSLGMIACAFLIVSVFTLDMLAPRDIAIPFLYALVVGSCLWWATSRQLVAIVGAISVLIVVGIVLGPEGRLRVGLVNDGIALLTMTLLAYSGLSYRSAVDKLQQRERELTDFVENAPIGLHWVGPDGTILWANQEELDMLGYEREKYLGHNIAEFHVDRPVIDDILGKLKANVTLKAYEARLWHKDGSLRHVVIFANAYFMDGRFIHTRCFTRDVSDRLRADHAVRETRAVTAANAQLRTEIIERRAAEAALREREELLRITFDTAPIGIAIVDREARFLKTNAAYQRMVGYAEEELRHKTSLELTHQDDLPKTQALLNELIEGKRDVFDLEKRFLRKDGQLTWVRTRVSVVKDERGELRFAVGVVQDITERKRAERILAESEERYRYLFESNPVPMWIRRDDTLEILTVNDATVRSYGYTRDEFDRMTAFDLQSADNLAAYEKQVRERPAGISTHRHRSRHRRKDGSIIDVDITSRPLSYAGTPARLVLAQDITERLNAETALREREEMLRITFDAAPIGINLVDLDRRFIRANVAYQKLVGYSENELRAMGTFDLNHPDDTAPNRILLQELMSGARDFFEIEKRYRTKQGEWIWVRNRVSLFRNAEGEPKYTVAAVQDITEQKRTEEAIRDSEQQMRLFMLATADCLWNWDLISGNVVRNTGFNKAFGYAAQDMDSSITWWEERLHADDRKRVLSTYRDTVARGGDACSYEYRFRRKDDTYAVVSDNVYVVRDASGKPRRALGAMTDITERKRAEAVQAQLAAIVENSNDAIISRTLDGTFLSWNAGAERMLGYTAAEAIGKPVVTILPPGQPSNLTQNNERMLRGEVVTHETTRTAKDGRVIDVLASHSPIRDSAGNIVGASLILTDITALKQAQRDLERKTALAQLLESLARAANEAQEPREAMRLCLERICAHGDWVLGRLGMYRTGESESFPQDSVWHDMQPGRFAEFKAASLDLKNFSYTGHFVTIVIRENKPVWLEDIACATGFGRQADAVACGLRSAFAFPVSVRGEVVAFLEFYAEKPRPADADLMAASTSVGAMLGRLLERSQAATERERLARIVEDSGAAIWSRGADDTLISWNAAAERLFGWTRAEAMAHQGSFLVPPDRLHEKDVIQERLARDDSIVLETVRLRKDGTPIDVELRASVTRDASRNVVWTAFIVNDITERKRAEVNQARLAAIVEHATVAIFSRTLDGTILSWNAGAEKMLGYTAVEAIGQPAVFTLPPGRPQNLARNNESLVRGEVTARESNRMTKDGRVIEVLTSHSPVRDSAGSIIGASVILQDITALRHARDAIRDSEERFRAAFDQAAVGMALRNIVPRISRWLRVNHKMCEIFGYTQEELLQLTPLDVTAPEDRGEAIVYNDRIGRGEITSYTREKRYVRKNGEIFWGSLSVSAVRGPDGRATHVISAVHDITERKRTERVLSESREYYRQLFDSNPMPMWITDYETRGFLQVNQAAIDKYGYTRDEFLGMTAYEIRTPEEAVAYRAYVQELVSTTDRTHLKTRHRRKDGSVIDVETTGYPHHYAGKLARLVLIDDVTERLAAERALRESEVRFRAAFEQAAVGMALRNIDPGNPRWLRVNRKMCEIFGYTREEFLQLTPVAVTALDEQATASEYIERVQQGEISSYTREKRYVRKNGEHFWANLSVSAVRGPDGRATHVIAAIQDITDKKRSLDAVHALATRQGSIADLGVYAVTETDVQKVMDRATMLLRDVMGASHAKILRLLPDGKSLLLVSGAGWKDGLVGNAIIPAELESQAGYTLLQRRMADGGAPRYDPVIVEDFRTERRFRAPVLLKEHGIRSGMSVVVYGAGTPFGVLGVHSAELRSFTADDTRFLEAISSVLSAAIQRAENYEQISQSREQLRALASRMVTVREEERVAIAREVHDELGQALTAIKIDVALLRETVDRTKRLPRQRIREDLASVTDMIDQSVQSVRKISTTLRPILLDELGFAAAFESQGRYFEKRHHIRCRIVVTEPITEPSGDAAIALFRIFQEALTNVVRHSGARDVVAEFRQEGGDIVLRVTDDGRGMPAFNGASSKNLGLAGMRERAMMFGGNVRFESAEGRGTTVIARIPSSAALQV